MNGQFFVALIIAGMLLGGQLAQSARLGSMSGKLDNISYDVGKCK